MVPALHIKTWAFSRRAALIGLKTNKNIPLSHITDICLIVSKDPKYTT